MQYRGKLKNQVYLCQINTKATIPETDEQLAGASILLLQNNTEKSIGEIINAAAQAPGIYRALVSLPIEIQPETLQKHLRANDKEISLTELKVPGYAINKRQ